MRTPPAPRNLALAVPPPPPTELEARQRNAALEEARKQAEDAAARVAAAELAAREAERRHEEEIRRVKAREQEDRERAAYQAAKAACAEVDAKIREHMEAISVLLTERTRLNRACWDACRREVGFNVEMPLLDRSEKFVVQYKAR